MKILLISKYSIHCQKLHEFLDANNLINVLDLRLVCIDNENVRKRIKNSEIEINNVPCLLSIVDNMKIEKFEGGDLNRWISFHFEQFLNQQRQNQPPPPQNQPPQNQPPQMMQPPPPQMIHQQPPQMMQQPQPQYKPIEEEEEEDNFSPDPNTSTERFAQSQMLAQQQLKIEQLQMKPNMIEGTSSIDDLIGDENDVEELTHSSIQEIVGKKGKKKKEKYTSSVNDYNEYETKNKKREQKKLDLLNTAMLMKKSREEEDKSINKSFTSS